MSFFQPFIDPALPLVHLHTHHVRHELGKSQVVPGLHRDGDVADGFVDFFFGTRTRLVGENHLRVPLVRQEVPLPVMREKSSETLAHVQEPEPRPEIHEAVA